MFRGDYRWICTNVEQDGACLCVRSSIFNEVSSRGEYISLLLKPIFFSNFAFSREVSYFSSISRKYKYKICKYVLEKDRRRLSCIFDDFYYRGIS